jgi:hypothetical protein
MSMNGQSSGDFRETSGRVQLFHVVTRNSVGVLSGDSFTQANPPVATGSKSTTLSGITKTGVLGGSVAFTRALAGNNVIGGPVVDTPAATAPSGYHLGIRPLGIFLNDAAGNAYENTPGPASGRGPYVCGSGSCIGLTIYETQVQLGAHAGEAIGNAGSGTTAYAPGDLLYASVNGLITNVVGDAYEGQSGAAVGATVIGILKAAVDATTPMLIVDLRI